MSSLQVTQDSSFPTNVETNHDGEVEYNSEEEDLVKMRLAVSTTEDSQSSLWKEGIVNHDEGGGDGKVVVVHTVQDEQGLETIGFAAPSTETASSKAAVAGIENDGGPEYTAIHDITFEEWYHEKQSAKRKQCLSSVWSSSDGPFQRSSTLGRIKEIYLSEMSLQFFKLVDVVYGDDEIENVKNKRPKV